MRIIFVCALFLLSACTAKDGHWRAAPPLDVACAKPVALGARNREGGKAAACFVQKHHLPGQGWAERAARDGVRLERAADYTLAFVEMSEAKQTYANRAQLDAMLAEIGAPGQTYVMTYVHGWRHDAAIGNTDVAKFRVILGYTRAALNTRCLSDGTYCDARLVGVYLSWRGRSFAEPVRAKPAGLNPSILGALPTFATRKQAGERHIRLIHDTLRAMETRLDLRPGDTRADKMLVFGHSMGGNMLLTMADEIAASRIAHHRPGTRMKPLYGDLMVLINPATEAAKWATLQRAERARAGLGPQDRILSQRGNKPAVAAHEKLYPIDQRPVLVSLTSASGWSALSAVDARRRIRFDWATGVVFPIGQRLLAGKNAPLERIAMGHLKPGYVDVPAAAQAAVLAEQKRLNEARKPGTPPVLLPKPWLTETRKEPLGASHEYALTRGGGTRTTYAASAEPSSSWCAPATGWLRAARQAGGSPRGLFFDWGLEKRDGVTAAIGNVGEGPDGASGQWRNRMYMPGHHGARSVAAAMSPFWNARVLDNAIREHDGFQNYVLWCNVNQLVLDDVTAPRPAPLVVGPGAVSTAEAEEAPVIEGESGARLSVGD